ncbi:primase-helicase family protein [Methylocaldum sp. MU1018]
MIDLKHDTSAAIDFLRRFHPDTFWVLTAIIPDGKTETVTFTPEKANEAARWIEGHQGKRNLYFHVNPVRRPLDVKASKEDIERLAWLHVDIDPRPKEPEDPRSAEQFWNDERTRIRDLLSIKRPPAIPEPSFIIDSGGGFQGFWALEPSDKLEIGGDVAKAQELEAYNVQLEKVFQADHTHNCDRLMRLPGTINVPTEKKARKGRKPAVTRLIDYNGNTYSIEEFTPAVRVQTVGDALPGGRPKVKITGNVPDVGVDELRAWAQGHGKSISDHCLALIATGQDPLDPTKYPSRSEALFKVCCDLVRAEVPDEMIYAVITGGNEIAASVRDKPNWEAYALRQIERAHEEAIDPWLRKLNEKHAVISSIGGKCRIIEEVTDRGRPDGRTILTKQSFEDFRNRYRHIKVTVGFDDKGKPIEKAAGAFWIDHPQRRQYETIAFAPGKEIEDAYNLWRGFAVDSLPGDKHASFLAHLRDNVCSGNAEHFAYLIGWMARTVQQPGSPGESAVVLRGRRGTGKSFFAKKFGHLFGRHFLQVANSQHLVGNFNAHLRDTVLLFGDEAFYAGDKKHESILKTLVTEENIVIEGKGVDAEAAPNYTHLILASNEDWVVPAGLDERRFFVIEMSDGHKQDHAYFAKIQADLDGGGYENLLHFLRTYDLSNFEVRRVPNTQALEEQKGHSLPPVQLFFRASLRDGNPPAGTEPHWSGSGYFVTSDALIAAMRDQALLAQGTRGAASAKDQIGKFFSELGFPLIRESTGRRRYGYRWDVLELRAAWDRWRGFPEDWPPLPEDGSPF